MTNENLTPAMKQYFEIKEKYKEAIVFFRMGDFYEMFWEDAHIAHKVLWVALTSRNKNAAEPIALAWIPYHAKEKYLPKLIEAGYKVVLVEQVPDPNLKGIVKRVVDRIITPSTLHLEGENYDNNGKTQIMSIVKIDSLYALSILDLSSSTWKTSEVQKIDQLLSYLYGISPQEVIIDTLWSEDAWLRDLLERKYQITITIRETKKRPRICLQEHFWSKNLLAFGIEDKELCQKACALLLEYSEENQNKTLDFLRSISYFSIEWWLFIDEATMKNLDIFFNFSTKSGKEWTLFWHLNMTKTSQGKRKLQENLLKPFSNKQEIESRYLLVEEFTKKPFLLEKIREQLKSISDLDMILWRVSIGRWSPRDLLNIKNSLQSIKAIKDIIDKEGSAKLKNIFYR